MIFHLLLAVMLSTGPDYSVSGPFASVDECRAAAKTHLRAYPAASVRAVWGQGVPGHEA